MRAEAEYNPEAFGEHIKAEFAYLHANGWCDEDQEDPRLPCVWSHVGKSLPNGPQMKGREGLDRSHAVNVQKQFDARCAAYVAARVEADGG